MGKRPTFKKHSNWTSKVLHSTAEESMYSVDGAYFQEYALSNLDYVHSEAHQAIGRLVREINNGRIDDSLARMIYDNLLSENY